MKWFLILWAAPIAFLGSWYGLSYYDMSFGIFMLTRDAHDLVFRIYGHVLGMPPESIPPLVARAIVIDSLLVFAIIAFRQPCTTSNPARCHRSQHDGPGSP